MPDWVSPEQYATEHGIRKTVKVAVDERKGGNNQKAIDYYRAALRSSEKKRGVNNGVTIDIRQDLAELLFIADQPSAARELVIGVLMSAEQEFAQSLTPQGHGDDDFRTRLWLIIKKELNRWYERARVAHEEKKFAEATADFVFLKRRLALLWKDLGEPTGSVHISEWISGIQSHVDHALRLCEKDNVLSKLRAQIEYYFKAPKLEHDSYLRKSMNDQGYVLLFRVASFRTVYSLSKNIDLIRQACEESAILEVRHVVDGVDRIRAKDRPERWVLPATERSRDIPVWKLREFATAVQTGETQTKEFQNWEAKQKQAHKEKTEKERQSQSDGSQLLSPPSTEAVTHGSRSQSTGREANPASSNLTTPPDPRKRRNSEGNVGSSTVSAASAGPHAKLFDTQDRGDGQGVLQPWFSELLETRTQPLLSAHRKEGSFHIAGCKWWRSNSGCKCAETKNRRRVRIAILDTGIDFTNETLKKEKRIKATYSPCPDQFAGDEDISGHGTHLTSLLLRIAPAADIYVARVCTNTTDFSEANIVSAIDQAVQEWDVDIITMSFGFDQHMDKIAATLLPIHKVLMFAAASNSGLNSPGPGIAYPARADNVFAIFATNHLGTPSDFNPNPTDANRFGTLGEDVVSTHLAGKTKALSGTSVATPIAAATAALILEFVRQKPQSKIEGLQRLEDYPITAMRKIFDVMSKPKFGYMYIPPWELLNIEPYNDDISRARDKVSGKISAALEYF